MTADTRQREMIRAYCRFCDYWTEGIRRNALQNALTHVHRHHRDKEVLRPHRRVVRSSDVIKTRAVGR